jgi:phage terminase small subunit
MPALSNPRWEAFCQALARGEHVGNARACYKLVYKRDDRPAASRLQHRADISQRVVEIRAEIAASEAGALRKAAEALGVTKEWVLGKLVEVVERCMQHKAVLDEDGQPIGEFKFDAAAALKGLELLGKHVGLFVPAPEPMGLKVGVQFVDAPPRETREQWEARRKRELMPKANGDGKLHS